MNSTTLMLQLGALCHYEETNCDRILNEIDNTESIFRLFIKINEPVLPWFDCIKTAGLAFWTYQIQCRYTHMVI